MTDSAIKLSDLLVELEHRFNTDESKIHILRVAEDHWNDGNKLRVTDLLKVYARTSRATTHRAIKELVSSKLLREQPDTEDRRVKYLVPGTKFDKYEQTIKGAL